MLSLTPRVAAALVIGTLALSGCSGAKESVRDDSGAIAEANENASVFDMREGDCFNEPDVESEEVETLPAVPCSQDHTFEVYEDYTVDEEDFPGVAALEATTEQVCGDEFEKYVGVAYDDSVLELYYLYPTSQSWEQGDKKITCLVYDPESATSGTLKDAKR